MRTEKGINLLTLIHDPLHHPYLINDTINLLQVHTPRLPKHHPRTLTQVQPHIARRNWIRIQKLWDLPPRMINLHNNQRPFFLRSFRYSSERFYPFLRLEKLVDYGIRGRFEVDWVYEDVPG